MVKLRGCKTSAANQSLRALGMRGGGRVRGEAGAAIHALPVMEAALAHPNTRPGAVGGQETGCLLKESAAIVWHRY